MKLFDTEEEAIKWVGLNIALMIKPKQKAKTVFINPFTSSDAYIQVIQDLGKKLFKHQQTKNHE
jgi:hypothetical protein